MQSIKHLAKSTRVFEIQGMQMTVLGCCLQYMTYEIEWGVQFFRRHI